MRHSIRAFFLLIVLTGMALMGASSAHAQENAVLPELPAPIQNLVNEGAQIRYLGNDHGVEAWITIKNGQEQYFYVLPGRKAFLMGVMFDDTGKVVTVEQVRKLRANGDNLLDELADDNNTMANIAEERGPEVIEFKSPSERLFFDIENSNWVPLGEPGAPVVYSFIDPKCPHCHSFIENLKDDYLMKGRVQLRMIPIGFREETRAQAAYLLATPDPQGRWYAHMDGNEEALPARAEINQQGVQHNLSIMQSWKLNVTPLIIYRAKDGSVKIIRGQPKDLPGMVADLGARS